MKLKHALGSKHGLLIHIMPMMDDMEDNEQEDDKEEKEAEPLKKALGSKMRMKK